jgi:putative heme-binding domain-containing protein
MSNSDPGVREFAEATFENLPSRSDVLAQFEPMLRAAGRPTEGRKVFQEVCASCHRLDGLGSAVGPDLSPLRNRGARFMLTNIIDPNRELDARYESYTAILEDGLTITGIVTSESDSEVNMVSADGKVTATPRSEIVQLQASGQSLMPEGLERALDERKLQDLLAFLLRVTANRNPTLEGDSSQQSD